MPVRCSARCPRLLPNASLEEARAVLTASGAPALVVADIDGRYLGMLSALDLYHRGDVVTRPPLIGGMATPFGVFLTNGEVSGGAGPAALMATGGMLHILLMAGIFVTFTVIDAISPRLLNAFGPHGIAQVEGIAVAVLPALFFFTLLRLLPLSGTHGAEHMVVHAIERREPLTYEVVRRMPRVHPRCGTNLAVGAMLFIWLIGLTWDNYREIGALFALAMTVLLWRPLGGVFQKYVTTKTPTRPQLEGAIGAGQELLGKYKLSVRAAPSFARRILMSGLPWVLSGWFITFAVVYFLMLLLHFNPAYLGLG